MKVGDLVKHVYPGSAPGPRDPIGIIVKRTLDPLASSNRVFRVLWLDGSHSNNIWDYDLEIISESR